MSIQKKAYGWRNGAMRCVNAEPGTYGHECGKPAEWIGTTSTGFRACYCSDCKKHGHEANAVVSWFFVGIEDVPARRIAPDVAKSAR